MSDSTDSPQYIQLPLFPTKRCIKCGSEYPITPEFWKKRASSRDGFRNECRPCRNKDGRKYYHAHLEKQHERSQRYRRAHRLEATDRSRRWRQANRERVRENQQRWLRANPDKKIEYSRRWRAENLDKMRELQRQWSKRNPDKSRAKARIRRARKLAAPGNHTIEETRNTYQQQGGKCFHCETPLNGVYHEDHWIPLSRGGSDYIENIRLLCPLCNQRKNSRMPWEWSDRYPPPD